MLLRLLNATEVGTVERNQEINNSVSGQDLNIVV